MIGLGLGNLFPLALAVCVALAPDRAQLAIQPRVHGRLGRRSCSRR